MNSLLNLMPKLKANVESDEAELSDEERLEEKRRQQRIHDKSTGPRSLRHVTNGQIRRMQIRQAASERRKNTLRYRRRWHLNQHAVANLRGQLQVVGAFQPYGTERPAHITEAMRANAMTGLRKVFGTYEDPQVVDEDGVAKTVVRLDHEVVGAAHDAYRQLIAERR